MYSYLLTFEVQQNRKSQCGTFEIVFNFSAVLAMSKKQFKWVKNRYEWFPTNDIFHRTVFPPYFLTRRIVVKNCKLLWKLLVFFRLVEKVVKIVLFQRFCSNDFVSTFCIWNIVYANEILYMKYCIWNIVYKILYIIFVCTQSFCINCTWIIQEFACLLCFDWKIFTNLLFFSTTCWFFP